MTHCPFCGQFHPPEISYCPITGEPLSVSCSNCGEYFGSELSFCPTCAEPLKSKAYSQTPPPIHPAQPPLPTVRGHSCISILLLSAFILLGIALILGGAVWLVIPSHLNEWQQSFLKQKDKLLASLPYRTKTPPPIASLATLPPVFIPTATQSLPTLAPPPTATPVIPTPTSVYQALQGKKIVRLTNAAGSAYNPSLSFDQSELLFCSKIDGIWQIFSADPNGNGNNRQITSGSVNYYNPMYDQKKEKILAIGESNKLLNVYYLSPNNGEVLQQLTENHGNNYAPVWFPDYSRILFTRSLNGNSDIYTITADGSNEERLTNDPAFDGYGDISPDGTQIVFYSDRYKKNEFEIYIMPLNTLQARRLTTGMARAAEPVFSLDGQWIVFESNYQGNYELYAMRFNGNDLHNITNNSANDQVPSFSPDGKWLLFQSDRDGTMNIYRTPWQLP